MADVPTPVCLLIDDPTPLIHLYRHHIVDLEGKDALDGAGQRLLETIPNDFLDRFCDVVEHHGIRGKFSIVPEPAGKGDVVRGIAGHDPKLTQDWMGTVKKRLAPFMDFGPEMITHSYALDLGTGRFLPETEHEWSQHQTREALTPYIARALSLLKQAGVESTGVTSPWMFAQESEPEYVPAIAAAMKTIMNRDLSWYFLHIHDGSDALKPRVMLREGGSTVVSIEASADDHLMDAIWKTGKVGKREISSLTDPWITADGTGGVIPRTIEAGGWPVLLTHWQSLWTNGRETGLAVLDETGKRLQDRFGDSVRWSTCLDLAERISSPPTSS